MRYASARPVLQAAILVSLFTSIAQSQTTTAVPAPQASLTTTQVNWPQFHFTFNGTRRNSNETVLNAQTVPGLKVKWTYTMGAYSVSSPAVANGVVYIGSADSNLYALNAKTGAKIWSFSGSPGPVNSSPTVVNGIVYSTSGYNLYALNATTGAKLWSFTAEGVVDDSPTVANGVVFFGSDDFYVHAIAASNGTELWRFQTNGYLYSTPAVAKGIV